MREKKEKQAEKIEKQVRSNMENYINEKTTKLVKDTQGQIDKITASVSKCVKTVEGLEKQKLQPSLVIRNLPEGDLIFESRNKRAGVIVATFNSIDDKNQIFEKKHRLKDTRQYSDVVISHDRSLKERQEEANLRAIGWG